MDSMTPDGHASAHADARAPAADQLLRRGLHELAHLQSLVEQDAEVLGRLRAQMKSAAIETEQEAARQGAAFSPADIGRELQEELKHTFGDEVRALRPVDPGPPPASLAAAESEWRRLMDARDEARSLVRSKLNWNGRTFKLKGS